MNWSGKMWALQTVSGVLLQEFGPLPTLIKSRDLARDLKRRYYPTTKVVRVQVDVKVIE